MNKEEINKQIGAEYQEFLDSPYGKDIPENLIDLFEKALMVVPPQAHKVNFNKVKAIVGKELYQLSISDINDIIKVVWNTPLQQMYDNLYEAIPEQIKMEKFFLKFEAHIKEQQQKMEQKAKRLESLSGGILGNGLQSVPNRY